MKNSIMILLVMVLSVSTIFAQATVESIVIEKHNRNAMKLYVDQSEEITAAALEARLKRSGISGKRKKGVVIYRGVVLSEISDTKLDIYTRVQQKGIGCLVYMAASKGYDNFATPEDEQITYNIAAFLNTFVADANYRSVDVDLTQKTDNISQQEKAYQKLLEEQRETEKKKSDAEVKLLQLQNDLDAKKIALEKLKAELDALKYKRTTINQQ